MTPYRPGIVYWGWDDSVAEMGRKGHEYSLNVEVQERSLEASGIKLLVIARPCGLKDKQFTRLFFESKSEAIEDGSQPPLSLFDLFSCHFCGVGSANKYN